MKKIATTLAMLALSASTASAVTLLSESFSYPNGNLVPNGGWATHSGSGATAVDIQVVNGRAVGDNNNAPDDNRTFAAQPTNAPTYACFEVVIPDPGGQPKVSYFAHFKDTGTTNFFSRVYVLPAGATGFTFGLSFSSTSASVGPVAWSATPLNYDQPYFIVIKYDPSTLTSTMWVNPTDESSTSISHTGTGSAFSISAFALRQSFSSPTLPASQPNGTAIVRFSVDNLGVGTTFADACYQVTPTRTGTWGHIKTLYR
jgi:hypothetical protein